MNTKNRAENTGTNASFDFQRFGLLWRLSLISLPILGKGVYVESMANRLKERFAERGGEVPARKLSSYLLFMFVYLIDLAEALVLNDEVSHERGVIDEFERVLGQPKRDSSLIEDYLLIACADLNTACKGLFSYRQNQQERRHQSQASNALSEHFWYNAEKNVIACSAVVLHAFGISQEQSAAFLQKEQALSHQMNRERIADLLRQKHTGNEVLEVLCDHMYGFCHSLNRTGLGFWGAAHTRRYFGYLENITELEMRVTIPDDIRDGGIEQSFSWLTTFWKKNMRPRNEVRLFILGANQTAKDFLRKKVFQQVENAVPPTEGLEILNTFFRGIQVNIWELGDPRDHLTRSFLNAGSFYLVCFEQGEEKELKEMLSLVHAFSPRSSIIAVGINNDSEAPPLELEDKETYFDLNNLCMVDDTAEDAERVATKLEERFLANPKTKQQILSSVLEQIRLNFNEFVQSGDKLIRYDEFVELCVGVGLDDADAQFALSQDISDLGIAMYCDLPDLSPAFVLDSCWWYKGAYNLLHCHVTELLSGRVPVNLFGYLVNNSEADPTKHAHNVEDCAYLLAFMKSVGLCCVENAQDMIIPSALEKQSKLILKDTLKVAEKTHYVVRYKKTYPVVIHRFIAKTLYSAEGNDYWETGIRIFDNKTDSEAWVELNSEESLIDIYISGKNIEACWVELRSIFRKINREMDIRWQESLMLDIDD